MFQTHLQLLQTPACPTPLSPLGEATLCTAKYYCQVYYRNQVLASGSTVITVQGLLSPTGPTTVQYNTSNTVVLRVNITPTGTFTRDYLRALTWYYNGVEINSGSHRNISQHNTTLTITNSQQSDAGVYHVQFAGLRIYPYNKLCEEETLAILRHYPLLSPVVFNVYTEDPSKSTGECPGYIRATPSSGVLPYTASDSISINISGNAPSTQRNWVYTSWYFNGYSSLPSGTSVSNLLKVPTGITQTLRINNPTPLHNGTYEVLLQLNTWSNSYFQQFVCPNDYWYFVYYSSRAGVYPIILDQISFNLQYYEPATVHIQSSRSALQDNGTTTLNCTADGGYPPTSSISFIKNGRVISTTSNDQLVISVAANDTHTFGRYMCVVNNSVTTMETSLLIKQKGKLQVVLDLKSSSHCDSSNNDTQLMLKTRIPDAIQEVCSCNFTSSDLEESEVTCSADDNTTLTFTTTVVYSTESGDMTASTLIRMFQDRAASTSTVISVGSQTATIVSVCSPTCIPDPQSSPTSTPELQEVMEPLTSNAATLVGVFLGGLATGTIILIITAVIVRIVLKKRTSGTWTGTKTTAAAKCKDVVHYTSETLQIGPNIAYEDVTYPQEIIYETPK